MLVAAASIAAAVIGSSFIRPLISKVFLSPIRCVTEPGAKNKRPLLQAWVTKWNKDAVSISRRSK